MKKAGFFTTILMTINFLLFHHLAAGQIMDKKKLARDSDSSVVTIYVYDYDGKQIIGSGIAIDSKGLILSNAHVFRSWESAHVYNSTFSQSYTIDKKCLKKDVENDIALFRIDGVVTKPMVMDTNYVVEKGDDIFCMGSPKGRINTFTDGMVGGLPELDIGSGAGAARFIQFSAKIFEGSSGGALINGKGHLIGMTTGSVRNEETGFAIPVGRISASMQKLGFVQPCGKAVQKIEPVVQIRDEEKAASNPSGFGQVSFYTVCSNCRIDIYIDDDYIGQVDTPSTRLPKCGQKGLITKTVYAGKHKVRAEDKLNRFTWEFMVDVQPQRCIMSKLNLDK